MSVFLARTPFLCRGTVAASVRLNLRWRWERLPAGKAVLAAACVVLCLAAVGCAAQYVPVLVESDPPGAELVLNGQRVGVTPAVVELGTRFPEHQLVLRVDRREVVRAVLQLPDEGLSVAECVVLAGKWTCSPAPGVGDYAFVLRFVRGEP